MPSPWWQLDFFFFLMLYLSRSALTNVRNHPQPCGHSWLLSIRWQARNEQFGYFKRLLWQKKKKVTYLTAVSLTWLGILGAAPAISHFEFMSCVCMSGKSKHAITSSQGHNSYRLTRLYNEGLMKSSRNGRFLFLNCVTFKGTSWYWIE